jgi:hypothetical protein
MRIEMNGMVIEGTVEELREIGVKFPVEEGEVQAAQEAELKVGDYAKVIEPGYCGDIEVGSIVKITNPKDDDGHYRVELLDGSDYDWFSDDQLEKITEEEFAQIRWAKIGRKPGEFKKGDIVRLLEDSGAHEAGTLVEVHDNGNYKADDSVWGGEFDWYELVVPVEQRFDLAAEAALQ